MKIAVVIAAYNFEPWINICFSGLYTRSDTQIIVFDNGSSDNTIEILEKSYPKTIIIKSTRNLGFGAANNFGIAKALETGAEYILLLNQDAHLLGNCLDLLIEVSQQEKEFGIISPFHLSGDGKNLDSRFSYYLARYGNRYLTNMLFRCEKPRAIYEVDFVNAAIWLLPASTIKRCGGFDSIFNHYGEDEDYVKRLSFFKLKAGVVPAATAIHDRPQKFTISEKDELAILNKNKLLILFKSPEKSLLRHYLSFAATHFAATINIFLGKYNKGIKEHLNLFLSATSSLPKLYRSRKKSYKGKMPFIPENTNCL